MSVISEFAPVLVSGLANGSTYAMMGIGLALVYGVCKVFNFAYGSFYSLGGYLAFLYFSVGFGYPLVFLCLPPALFFIAFASEKLVVRPLRVRENWETLVMMATLGLAVVMDNLYLVLFGPFAKALPVLFAGHTEIGGLVVSMQDIAILAISISVLSILWFFLNRTRLGMAMRAVAHDMVGADIVGIPKHRLFSYAFAIAAVLVGIAAVLLAPKYFVHYPGGWVILVKAWVITAFGGMGSLLGAVYAAFILGVVEAIVGWQLGLTWTLFAWFAILIGVFALRPQGLRGTPD